MSEPKKIKKEAVENKAPAGFTLTVVNTAGKEVGKLELDKEIFDGKVNKALLQQATVMYLANKRQGTSDTKTRANVSGGNSKPWRQKGTGRARHGSSRSPLWRHGGIVFGPHPRDYSYDLPKKMKKQALISSLNSRLNDKSVMVLDKLSLESAKTKEFAVVVKALGLKKKSLFVCDHPEVNVIRASKNIKAVDLKDWQGINARDVLIHNNFVITKQAFDLLTERLKKESKKK